MDPEMPNSLVGPPTPWLSHWEQLLGQTIEELRHPYDRPRLGLCIQPSGLVATLEAHEANKRLYIYRLDAEGGRREASGSEFVGKAIIRIEVSMSSADYSGGEEEFLLLELDDGTEVLIVCEDPSQPIRLS